MNRELKFRAWDGLTIRYSFLVAGPQFCEVLNVMQNKQFAIEKYGVKDWEVMQFTGLYDKNDVEIYEGDIIRYNTGLAHDDGTNEVFYTGTIEWVKNGWGIMTFDDTRLVFLFAGAYWFGYLEQEGIEVIGNIYETPELLPK